MLVVVSQAGAAHPWARVISEQETSTTEAGTEAKKQPPNPILPTGKELIWTIATFAILFALMRYWLYPRLKKGMDARYARIREQLESAERVRAEADTELAQYQSAIGQVRVEANQRLDAARQELDGERHERLTHVNAELSERRGAAADAAEAAREGAMGQIEAAVATVAANAAGRALGAPVDEAAARNVAAEVVRAGVTPP